MLITKKNRLAILSYLFKEGVIVAEKTTGHTDRNALMLHPDIMGVSTSFCEDGAVKTSPQRVRNLEVIKLMQSLTSKELVTERFAWKHYYWFLKGEGHRYLHIPEDVVPNTLKKSTKPAAPERPGGDRDGERGPPRGDRDGYRRGPPGGEGGYRGFGRGGGAPRPPA
ncbi:hypothetical protein EMIHUDRAFT_435099 [Emiliania huxleyi CCMP1516]|uniref:Plectin/eS10 N-terminal domain-containing protein n=2 Tax=Emiliania huxleyi TaxID=2903 RepID=A0A0D3JSR1_EMIH1|nr:hypothetical protein EMIHUDRAFT_435099 [Emiliania huxleyi CCMP1516]EOD26546.1 hypothetical protein EMIHUDRAFT_435099 [Emiliania huxleyi CCMP1516]|eukprot:XP_005778975.1 hypothetical protein EMIHUDRAFT_435099 [Emiliania huxleyi CCMP1516]